MANKMNKQDIPQHVADSAKLMEAEIEKWHKNPEKVLIENGFHHHFEQSKFTDWCAVSDEGLRIYNLVVSEDEAAVKGSAIAGVISSVAAAGAGSVLESLAMALGVSERSLAIVLEDYVEGDRADAMGMVEFARQVAQTEAEAKAEGKPSGPSPRP